jgi:hypothetical protein
MIDFLRLVMLVGAWCIKIIFSGASLLACEVA